MEVQIRDDQYGQENQWVDHEKDAEPGVTPGEMQGRASQANARRRSRGGQLASLLDERATGAARRAEDEDTFR